MDMRCLVYECKVTFHGVRISLHWFMTTNIDLKVHKYEFHGLCIRSHSVHTMHVTRHGDECKEHCWGSEPRLRNLWMQTYMSECTDHNSMVCEFQGIFEGVTI